MLSLSRRSALFLLCGAAVSSSRALACLWDTDTLKDELRTQSSVFDLITGQFPHHGDAYYKLRIKRLEQQGNFTIDDLNDLAVAHVRLKQFAKAETYLQQAISQNPDHYETLSNIGVTAKKQNDFKKGASYIRKALAIKRQGHMGLGNWYLKALVWRAQYENTQGPNQNFLGMNYSDLDLENFGSGKPSITKNDLSKSKPAMMVKNDQTFADGFLCLGDHLYYKKNLNLSFLAHTKAKLLSHQNPTEVQRRIDAYLKYNKMIGSFSREKRYTSKSMTEVAVKILRNGEKWLEKFKAAEAKLLAGMENEKAVTFDMVEAELKKQGIQKQRLDV